MTAGLSCPIPISPVCDLISGAGSGLAGDVLSTIVSWIVQGASWLLNQLGSVMSSTTRVNLGAAWFHQHYAVMASLAAVVAVPMLLLAAIQAIYGQSPAVLVRAAFVQLPLAGLLTAVAVQLVQLALTATNALSTAVSTSAGGDITKTLTRVASRLVAMGTGLPGFVLGLASLLVVAGALVLWLEMVVRAAAVYVAVMFLPLAMASLVWPAVSHWCRRLVETLASLILSKFVVVAVLSLAVGAIGTGKGFSTLLSAGALLLLAAFTPFTLLRLVPVIESGAALQLEGARQRAGHALGTLPRSAASFALRQARMAGLAAGAAGAVGTGLDVDPEAPGSGDSLVGGQGAAGPGGEESEAPGGGDRPGGGGALEGLDALGKFFGGRWGGTMDEATGSVGRGKWPFGPGPDTEPGGLPGTLPMWEADPEATAAVLSALHTEPPPLVPTAVGGIIRGVRRPVWGGTEPPSRFEPGPKDDWWTAEEYIRDLNSGTLFFQYPTQQKWFPIDDPPETLDGDVW